MSKVKRLAKQVERTIERWLGSSDASELEPLDLVARIVADIEDHVEPVGDGRRVLPYDRITVRVLAPGKTDRARLQAAFADLESRTRRQLGEAHCEVGPELTITTTFVAKRRADWAAPQRFDVTYDRGRSGEEGAAAPVPPTVCLTVLRGKAARKVYTFQETIIRLGRTDEPSDDLGRTRRNDVAFADDDAISSTVARAQATLAFTPAPSQFRIFDDGSANGTRILREGRTIDVPPRDPRGARLAHGDVIELGRARVRFEIDVR